MSLIRIATRDPVTVFPTASAAEAAGLMEQKNVGCVVVVREGRPVGILTDRDLVLRVMRKKLDPDRVKVEDVMTSKVECVPADRDPIATAVHMRQLGVRRLPVVGSDGRLLALVAFDDLVRHASLESRELADAVSQYPWAAGGA
jgi:CBS domain-containing protein